MKDVMKELRRKLGKREIETLLFLLAVDNKKGWRNIELAKILKDTAMNQHQRLKRLIAHGLVKKTEKSYFLTSKGEAEIVGRLLNY